MDFTLALKQRALHLGFDLCGIAPAERLPELEFLKTWIARRYYGTMSWIPRTARVRGDIQEIVPGARSVIVTGTLYNTDRPYAFGRAEPGHALVSRYAWGDDYHRVIGERQDALLAWAREHAPEPFDARPYVDTGPIQERVFAQRAGLGWVGKNTCLINTRLGSWLFLGAIVSTMRLALDEQAPEHCGTCTRCLEACPTGALVEPGVLDARLCISYLTIEKRGTLASPIREKLGTHVYGCDVCQEVCPWNGDGVVSPAGEWRPHRGLEQPSLVALWRATDADLEALASGGAMTRAPVASMRRNLAIAIGNSAGAVPPDLLDEDRDPARPSLSAPGVAEAIGWARGRIMDDAQTAADRQR
jgi:epoxyqueuosine reductase